MKTSHAVLVAAVVGVARLVLAERHNRRQLALHAAELHQGWIADVAANPELQAIWAPPGGDLSPEEHAQHLHCNRLVSFWSAKFRAGLLDKNALRAQARWLMEREVAQNYWKKFGSYRTEEAMDRKDRTFNAILADEYSIHADQDWVAA
ncbi:DUF6082 family protein [Streptomyces sp. BH105]|uniref:DUF6082 family protein n=1 Tax=Streptomyces sp. BH105 TaxID=3410408 RepID=UPI003CF8E779